MMFHTELMITSDSSIVLRKSASFEKLHKEQDLFLHPTPFNVLPDKDSIYAYNLKSFFVLIGERKINSPRTRILSLRFLKRFHLVIEESLCSACIPSGKQIQFVPAKSITANQISSSCGNLFSCVSIGI